MVRVPSGTAGGDGAAVDDLEAVAKLIFQLDVDDTHLNYLRRCSDSRSSNALVAFMLLEKLTEVPNLDEASEEVKVLIKAACGWAAGSATAAATAPASSTAVPVVVPPVEEEVGDEGVVDVDALFRAADAAFAHRHKFEEGTELTWSVWWYGLAQLPLLLSDRITGVDG